MTVSFNIKDRKSKKYFVFTLISFVLTSVLAIWFNNICGVKGLFNWHIFFRTLFGALSFLFVLPVISFVIFLFTDKKPLRITGYVLDCIAVVIWLGLFLFLTGTSLVKVKGSGHENMNILYPQEPLPSRARADGSKMHYAFTSDPHWGAGTRNAEATRKILRNIDKGDYDACFITGDIAEFGMFSSYYEEAVNDIKQNLCNTPFRAITGNHDTLINSLSKFKRTFMEKDSDYYYRMDNGNVHVIVLKLLWDMSEWSSKQEKWLVEQLESIPQEDTVIVVSHCYIISSGYYDSAAGRNWGDIPEVVETLCPILEKYNVDLHISGHDHFFEYSEKEGIGYAVVGTMGGKLDSDFCYYTPYSKWLDFTHFGWMDMKIFENKMLLDFLDEDGNSLYKTEIKTN